MEVIERRRRWLDTERAKLLARPSLASPTAFSPPPASRLPPPSAVVVVVLLLSVVAAAAAAAPSADALAGVLCGESREEGVRAERQRLRVVRVRLPIQPHERRCVAPR